MSTSIGLFRIPRKLPPQNSDRNLPERLNFSGAALWERDKKAILCENVNIAEKPLSGLSLWEETCNLTSASETLSGWVLREYFSISRIN